MSATGPCSRVFIRTSQTCILAEGQDVGAEIYHNYFSLSRAAVDSQHDPQRNNLLPEPTSEFTPVPFPHPSSLPEARLLPQQEKNWARKTAVAKRSHTPHFQPTCTRHVGSNEAHPRPDLTSKNRKLNFTVSALKSITQRAFQKITSFD